MNRINFSQLPLEISTLILEEVHQSFEEKAACKYAKHQPDDQKRFVGEAVAKEFVPLNLVSANFSRATALVLNQHEGTELATTKHSIQHLVSQVDVKKVSQKYAIPFLRFLPFSSVLAKSDQPMFRQHMVRLMQHHKHIEVSFKDLDLLQSQVVLEELVNAPKNNLSKVVLDFSDLEKAIWQDKCDLVGQINHTLNCMNKDQPKSQVELVLANSNIPQEALLKILNNLPNTQVHLLTLARLDLGDYKQLGQALAVAVKSPHLRQLSLSCCDLIPLQVKAIAQALPYSGLLKLDLNFNEMSSEAMFELSRNLPSSQLKELHLNRCSIEDVAIQNLAQSLPETQLEVLELGQNSCSKEGGVAIANALPRSKLKHLDLRLNKIQSVGAQAIAEALPHCALSHLNLIMNEIKDEGFLAFARTIDFCSNLKELDLSGNKPRYERSVRAVRYVYADSPYRDHLTLSI